MYGLCHDETLIHKTANKFRKKNYGKMKTIVSS